MNKAILIKQIESDLKQGFSENPKRYNHVMRTLETALLLQKHHIHVDKQDLTIAVLVHDIAKDDCQALIDVYLTPVEKLVHDGFPAIYHALMASKILEEKYHYQNIMVSQAISEHVYGSKEMSDLSKILFISDKAEPGRNYQEAHQILEIAKGNLNEAMYLALRLSNEFLAKKNELYGPAVVVEKHYQEVIKMKKELQAIVDELETLKAKDIHVYDFENHSPFYDYFIVATMNNRQTRGAINNLKKTLGENLRSVEGKDEGGWVLIDANSYLIHLFTDEERKYYEFDKHLIGIKRVL